MNWTVGDDSMGIQGLKRDRHSLMGITFGTRDLRSAKGKQDRATQGGKGREQFLCDPLDRPRWASSVTCVGVIEFQIRFSSRPSQRSDFGGIGAECNGSIKVEQIHDNAFFFLSSWVKLPFFAGSMEPESLLNATHLPTPLTAMVTKRLRHD